MNSPDKSPYAILWLRLRATTQPSAAKTPARSVLKRATASRARGTHRARTVGSLSGGPSSGSGREGHRAARGGERRPAGAQRVPLRHRGDAVDGGAVLLPDRRRRGEEVGREVRLRLAE